jgi:hypothetical protein
MVPERPLLSSQEPSVINFFAHSVQLMFAHLLFLRSILVRTYKSYYFQELFE